jgi:hypothetical protein
VIPGRRRKAADEAAPKAGKGRGKGAEAPQEELPDDASVPEVEPGPPEAGSEAPAEEATAEEATTEESEEEKAARYASLGREETPAPASEAVTPENGEEE